MTVTYDTEHAVTFNRLSPTAAESRSIATHIDEADGRDHGFLWRLNSYWRYSRSTMACRIRGESLSLSRRVPTVVKPVAGPIITPHRARFDGECARGRAPLPGEV